MEGLDAWARGMTLILAVQPREGQTRLGLPARPGHLRPLTWRCRSERPTLCGRLPRWQRAWHVRPNESKAAEKTTLSRSSGTGREPTANGRAAQEMVRALPISQVTQSPTTCTTL